MDMEIVDYAGSLGKISGEQFDRALRKLNLGGFIKAEKASGGVVGQNVFLTSTKGEFVFRGRPFYEEQFDVEKFMVDNLHKHTKVHVAYPYLIDNSAEIFGFKYAIMPKLKGIQIANGGTLIMKFSKEERLKIVRAMVEILIEMQQLKLRDTEKYMSENIKNAMRLNAVKNTEVYAENIINKITGSLENTPEITNEDIKFINDIVEQNRKSLLIPFEPCFVMGDFKEDNVLFSNTGGEWKVCGVFDFAMSHFGDGETDLSRIYAMYIGEMDRDANFAGEFIRTYIKLKPPREGFFERFKIYSIQERLGIWSWAKNRREGAWWDDDMPLREWLAGYLNLII